jgi:hypothetical protein
MARPSARPRAWAAYLAGGALVALAYHLVPATGLVPRWAAKIGLYNGLGLSAVAAILAGVRRHRPERPPTWYLFATGLLAYVTADIIFYTYQDILHREVFPSVADVFYLASYPFLVAGLLVTDTLYSWIQLTGGYHTGSPIDLGWMVWYACWGAAALHPTMGALAEPAPPREVRLSRWRLGLLAAASLLARPSRWSSWPAAGTPRAW